MKEFFSRDSVLKIVSFVVAVLLWIFIIIVVDPSVDITIRDIPVRYSNRSELEEQGLSLINDNKTRVELKVRGSRKKIAKINNTNVYATVDLASVSKKGEFSLPISISIPYEYSEIVSKKPYNAEVIIDKTATIEKEIRLEETGKPANGYIAGKAQLGTEKVRLEGAESVLEGISAVEVRLDYDGCSADINDMGEIYFIGLDNKKIPEDDNIYSMVKLSETSVQIKCDIYRLKTVPVEVVTDLSANISGHKITAQPSNITIYARDEVLAETEEIKTAKISAAELIEAGTASAELNLPEGVMARDVTSIEVRAELR